MTMSWKIGRVAGIDLYLHSTFLLLLAWVGASHGGLDAVALVTAVFGCVLLHEFGHALTARALCGIPTQDITLYPIGGVARLQRMPRKPAAELLITLAGPAVNVAIAAALAGLLWLDAAWEPDAVDTYTRSFLGTLMGINLLLAAFNMVPAFPMDGGRVLRALLSGPLGRLRATEIAAAVGKALALGFGIWSMLQFDFLRAALALFIYMAAGAELARVRAESRSPSDRGDGDGLSAPPPGFRWVATGQGVWRLVPLYVRNDDFRGGRSWGGL